MPLLRLRVQKRYGALNKKGKLKSPTVLKKSRIKKGRVGNPHKY